LPLHDVRPISPRPRRSPRSIAHGAAPRVGQSAAEVAPTSPEGRGFASPGAPPSASSVLALAPESVLHSCRGPPAPARCSTFGRHRSGRKSATGTSPVFSRGGGAGDRVVRRCSPTLFADALGAPPCPPLTR